MQRFFLKSFIFLLPILFIFYVSERVLAGKPIIPDFSLPFSKAEVINEDILNSEVAILGSSHANFNIDEKKLSYQTSNFGKNSQSIYYDYQIIKSNLPKMPKLKLILVTLSYFSLEYNITKSGNAWNQFTYEKAGYPFQDKKFYFDLKRYSLFAFRGRDASIEYLLTKVVMFFSRKNSDPDLSTGIDLPISDSPKLTKENPSSTSSASRFSVSIEITPKPTQKVLLYNVQARIDAHHTLMHPEDISENVGYIEEIIKIARERNIEVVFITHPVFSSYSDQMDMERYQTMQREIKRLSEKDGIDYFNYFYDKRFLPEDFSDVDHLDTPGISKFSKIINDEIIHPKMDKFSSDQTK